MMDEQEFASEPAALLRISDLETLRVVSDALRARILDALRPEPHTARALARQLGLSPKQLYYHLNLMERHGLIRVVRTRVVSGIIEKQYRATAYLFHFDREVFASAPSPDGSAMPPGLGMLFDATRNQLAQSYDSGVVQDDRAPKHQRLLMTWATARLAPDRAAAFYERLGALLDEFQAEADEPPAEEARGYRLFTTFFPLKQPADDKQPGANGAGDTGG